MTQAPRQTIVIEALERMLDSDIDEDSILVALEEALLCEDLDSATLVLPHHSEIYARVGSKSVLSHAIALGFLSVVHWLLEHGVDVNAPRVVTDAGVLVIAVGHGSLDMVRLLLSHGASLEAEDATSGDAALHKAARTGNWEMVLFLLDHGAEVNQFNKLGETALHIAVKDGRTAIAALLMDHGADVEECVRRSTVGFSRVLISDTRQVFQQIGQNPLHLATGRGHLQLASLLADRCVNLEALNTTGQTALHIAARFGRLELVDMFLDRDMPVDLLDQDGRTPLHWAAFHNKAAVPHLLSRGADPNAVAKNGMTPLHWASMSLYCDSVILLLNQGADLHAISHDGINALGCVLIDCELRYNLCRNHLLIAQELCARGLKIRHVEKRLSDRQVDLLSTILQYQASFERGELSRVTI